MRRNEITKREVLFSTVILAVMVGLGVWLSNPILKKATERDFKVISATRVKDADNFDYIRRTNVGHFLAEGELIANDTLRNPDIPGIYSKIIKVTEEYTEHTEEYEEEDEDGNVTTHTRTYWSWDEVKREEDESKTFTFLGKRFSAKEIGYRISTTKNATVKDKNKSFWGPERRFVYYTAPITVYGLMDGNADYKAYQDLNFRRDYTIDKAVERANKRMKGEPIAFWILWLIMTGAIMTLFYVCENKWLY